MSERSPVVLETDVAEALTRSRGRFLAFVQRRVADADLAEEILQESLLKAIEGAPELRDEERLTAWFYRILRNAIIDAYRRRDVRQRRHVSIEAVELDPAEEPGEEEERALCECFRALIPTLSPAYAEVIDSVDLRGEARESAAERLGITPNNLKVRHHRARQALRQRLEETCRLCARHGCLDCTCEDEGAEV